MEDREIAIFDTPVMDVMGNVILPGLIVAYSKMGNRSFYIGVVTALIKHGKSVRVTIVSGSFYKHDLIPGPNDSMVILSDPLYSLESKRINDLLASIDERVGKKVGDVYKTSSYRDYYTKEMRVYHYIVREGEEIPADYEFGVPWLDEQIIYGKKIKQSKGKGNAKGS